MNPCAGRAPPVRELVAAAERLGVETHVLRHGDDGRELALRAADAGARALGVAGGDGSLAPVASAALARDLPFAPVPLGRRNHFARDLGIDCGDPVGALAAFGGDERRVDVATANEHVFLNNVSLGLYAVLAHGPWHQHHKRAAALARVVPAVVGRSRRPLHVSFEAGRRRERRDVLVVVVANNDYGVDSLSGVTRRTRLDAGLLHAYVLEAVGPRRLVALLARAGAGGLQGAEGWAEWSSTRFRVDSARPTLRAARDGEPVVLEPPLEFSISPRALRVLVAR